MARSIEEIKKELIKAKEVNPNLKTLNSTSKVSIWRLLLYVVASSQRTLEELFDYFTAQIKKLINEQKVGSVRWYQSIGKQFQYGIPFDKETGVFKSVKADGTSYTEEEIGKSKIITYISAIDNIDYRQLEIKVAKGELPTPLSSIELSSFTSYMNQIKFAGINVITSSKEAYLLRVEVDIYREKPFTIGEDGVSILTAENEITGAIKKFLTNLPFDGRLVLEELSNVIEKVDGVDYIELKKVFQKPKGGVYVEVGLLSYNESGYLKFDEDNSVINYK